MLNLLEVKCAPTRRDVEACVHANFATHDGDIAFRCIKIFSRFATQQSSERLKLFEIGAKTA